jgi:futalosine hydrolase
MRVLFVAATSFEVESLNNNSNLTSNSHSFKVLITGVGMVATAYALARELALNQYDLAINLGIAGSFDRSIALGNIIEITEDNIAELGAEDDENFIPISQLGFGESSFKAGIKLHKIYKRKATIKQATAITVNKVHGNNTSISSIITRLNPELESMEGAAFFYACREAGVPSLQIRAVSNYVEKRNRDAWQIGLAVKNLNTFAEELLQALNMQDSDL